MECGETFCEPSIPEMGGGDVPDKHDKPKKRIKVRITLYFDGTGNNKVNTTRRMEKHEKFLKATQDDEFQGSSYFNDYSNVARLDMYTEKTVAGYDHYIKVYTEGIGTLDELADDTYGNTSGQGRTGVKAKVDKGLARAIALLGRRILSPQDFIIETVTVDVCGFSRGATAARYCIYRLLHKELHFNGEPPKEPFKKRLQRAGFEVEQVEVHAAGLFDTVSSMGVAYIDISDVTQLHLDAVREAKAVLHLAAAEEYRVCFSLTNIDSAVQAGVGHEVYLPGAHSDVGGGYVDGNGENKVVWSGDGSWEIADFLTHYGWGSEREVTVIVPSDRAARDHDIKKQALQLHLRRWVHYVRLERTPISNQYSYVPLHIMAKFLRKEGVPVKATLETEKNPSALGELADRIKAYADSAIASNASEASDWSSKIEPAIRELRHRHLHFSGKSELGYNLRTFRDFKQPTRRVYSDAR